VHFTEWFAAPSAPSWCGEIIGDVIFQMNDAAPADSIRANPPVLMNEREVALFVGICPRSGSHQPFLELIRIGLHRAVAPFIDFWLGDRGGWVC